MMRATSRTSTFEIYHVTGGAVSPDDTDVWAVTAYYSPTPAHRHNPYSNGNSTKHWERMVGILHRL